MSEAPPTSIPTTRTDPRGVLTVLPPLCVGGLIFGALAFVLHSQQDAVVSARSMAEQLDETGQLRPLADVIATTRSLKLVTVTVDSRVRTRVRDERWHGTASAVVEAPVKYVYGVDLSGLQPEAFRVGRILGMYEIEIPRPGRIAVEVDGSHPVEEIVEVSGARLRSRAGEFYLGMARKEIYEQARKNALPPETMKEIETTTREQVEDLVRRFVGPQAQVVGANPPLRRHRGRLGSERQRVAAAVVEGVHLLLDDVRLVADPPREQLGALEQGHADLAVAIRLEDSAGRSFDALPPRGLRRQNVTDSADSLDHRDGSKGGGEPITPAGRS
jgi:hypothetical protein